MSDKNPYYSIPKSLGEPREEINMLPVSEMSAMVELREHIERQIFEAFCPRVRQPQTALRVTAGGRFETVEIGADGKIVEPCRKCGPVLLCPEHMALIT